MIIELDIVRGEGEIVDWDDPDEIRVRVTAIGREDGKIAKITRVFNAERPSDEPQFFPQEEMTQLADQLLESEKRVVDLLQLTRKASDAAETIAAG